MKSNPPPKAREGLFPQPGPKPEWKLFGAPGMPLPPAGLQSPLPRPAIEPMVEGGRI